MGMLGERVRHRAAGRLMTKQSDALASDVNAIVKRHIAHGVPLPVSGREPRYGDFSSAMSAHESLNRVFELQDQFMELPASVRDVCGNSPVRFLELSETPEGMDRLVKAGMPEERKPKAEPPAAAPAVPAEGSESP